MKKRRYTRNFFIIQKGLITDTTLQLQGNFTISIKILEVNIGNSILDTSKRDKINDGIAKKIHI